MCSPRRRHPLLPKTRQSDCTSLLDTSGNDARYCSGWRGTLMRTRAGPSLRAVPLSSSRPSCSSIHVSARSEPSPISRCASANVAAARGQLAARSLHLHLHLSLILPAAATSDTSASARIAPSPHSLASVQTTQGDQHERKLRRISGSRFRIHINSLRQAPQRLAREYRNRSTKAYRAQQTESPGRQMSEIKV